MQPRNIRSSAYLVLTALLAACGAAAADPAPATSSTGKRLVIKVSGNSNFDGKNAPKTDQPLEISVAALRGKWVWDRPDTAKLVLTFSGSTDFAYTYDTRNKLAANPNGRAQLSIDIANVGSNSPALAWSLDMGNHRVRLAEVNDEDEVGSPGREWSAEIQLIRNDILLIKGRLPTYFADFEFDAFLVRVPPKVVKDVADLVRRLGKDNPKEVRLAAANELYDVDQPPDKETVPVLAGWVKEQDPEIRIAALNALTIVLMQTKGECPLAVVEAIFDKDNDVASLAAGYMDCYETFPAAAQPLLFRAIESDDAMIRQGIPSALVKAARDDKRTVRALKKAIEDKDVMVRIRARVALLEATHDFDVVVPYWLIANENYQELTETVRAGLTADQISAQEKYNAEASLAVQSMRYHGKKKPHEMGRCLIGLLSNKSPVIRRAAVRTLGALAGDKDKNKAVFRELGAKEAVVKLLDDSDASVQRAARIALEKLGE